MFRYPTSTPGRAPQTQQPLASYGTPQMPGGGPFMQASPAAFNSAKADAGAGGSSAIKPPKPPDRPLVPYMRFSRKMWAKVRAENPDRQLWDIGKVIGQMWREASDQEKAVYQEEYEEEKVEYDKLLKTYHNSASYQAYLASKNRAKMQEKAALSSPMVHMNRSQTGVSTTAARVESAGVVIQPVDEDDGEGQMTVRRVASVRFERNHRLIADLFNGSIVTDTRTVVSQQRIDMLRKQAQSLAMHQSKLEEELKRLEDGFLVKKRTIEGAGQGFADKLKRVCEEKPQVDETKYNTMVVEATSKLALAYEQYKIREQAQRGRQEAERQQLVGQTPILYQLTATDNNTSPRSATAEPASSESQQEQQQQQDGADNDGDKNSADAPPTTNGHAEANGDGGDSMDHTDQAESPDQSRESDELLDSDND
uniref:HMG box domain-containing protein n=1 Tax=Plectus sambesii TaxID=2011161 RepID=A0A914W567_9BILA